MAPQPGDETIDAGGAPLVAPLVNGHTHAAMTLFRGYGGDLPLMRWLQEMDLAGRGEARAEDVYWGARLACAEMIRTGTTRFWDMYWHPEATARAVARRRAAGDDRRRRCSTPTATPRRCGRRRCAASSAWPVGPTDRAGPRPALDLHGQRGLAALDRGAGGRARGADPHPPLRDRAGGRATASSAHGVRPAAYLDRLGMLSERTVLAHGVWLDRAELELIAERGCTVVSNPVANMKLAVGGVFPYPAAREAGVAVGLGTDGAGSNDSLDLFADLKAFALAQQHAAGDPTVARRRRGLGDRHRRPGAAARRRCEPLRSAAPPTSCCCAPTRPSSALATSPRTWSTRPAGSIVDTTVVGGRVLMRGGEVPGARRDRRPRRRALAAPWHRLTAPPA